MKFSRFLLYPALFPTDLFHWWQLSIMYALWGESIKWENGSLVARSKEGSWIERRFPNTTGITFGGHAIWLQNGGQTTGYTLNHEFVHVKQFERSALTCLLLSSPCFILPNMWPIGLVTWLAGPVLMYYVGDIVALCYGDDFYRGNIDEIAAYDRIDIELRISK